MSAGTTRTVLFAPAHSCTSGASAIRWPLWFSSHGANEEVHSASRTASRPWWITRVGKPFLRFVVLLVEVALGLHIALATIEGVVEIARKTATDPLGMVLTSCVITLGLLLTSFCYSMVRNQLTSRDASRRVIGFGYGIAYAIVMTFSLVGFSKLFQLTLGQEVRQSLPVEIDYIFLALSMALAAIICVELRTLRLWDRIRPRGRHD